MKSNVCLFAAFPFILSCILGSAVAGPLSPPAGAVLPTHKTLTEVEPRVAISATNTPGDGSSFFRITQPGSYYLTANFFVGTIEHGLQIDLSIEGLVTIDLNGFTISGSENALNGIDVDGPFQPRVVLRNGFVTGFNGNGVDLAGSECATVEHIESSRNSGKGFVIGTGTFTDCKAQFNSLGGFVAGDNSALVRCDAVTTGPIGIEAGDNCRLTQCSATGASSRGIQCESNCTLTDCVAANNPGYGIHAYLNATIKGCTARDNGEGGFSTNQSATLIACTAYSNTKWGFSSGGTSVFQGCTAKDNGFAGFTSSFSQLSECIAVGNTLDGFSLGGISNVSKCSALSNLGSGFSAGGACVIVECSAMYNNAHGIFLSLHGNTVRGNNCTGNGQGATPGAGIQLGGNSNRVENNLCKDNDFGIDIDGTRNVITGNTCADNTQNWAIAANNSYGAIIDRSAAVTAGMNGANFGPSTMGTTDPHANFTN